MVRYIFIILTFFSLIHASPASGQTDNLLTSHFSDYELIDSVAFDHYIVVDINDYTLTTWFLDHNTEAKTFWVYSLRPFQLLWNQSYSHGSARFLTAGKESAALVSVLQEDVFLNMIYRYDSGLVDSFETMDRVVEVAPNSLFYRVSGRLDEPNVHRTWQSRPHTLCDTVLSTRGNHIQYLGDSIVIYVGDQAMSAVAMNALSCETEAELGYTERVRKGWAPHAGISRPVNSKFFAIVWHDSTSVYNADFEVVNTWPNLGYVNAVGLSPDGRYCATISKIDTAWSLVIHLVESGRPILQQAEIGKLTRQEELHWLLWSENLLIAIERPLTEVDRNRVYKPKYRPRRTWMWQIDDSTNSAVGPAVLEGKTQVFDLGDSRLVIKTQGDWFDSTTSRIEVWQRKH